MKKKFWRKLTLSLFIISSAALSAQDSLSLEEAVAIGLRNNLGIIISSTQLAIDSVGATKGNAGFWPQLNADADAGYGNTFYSSQTYSDDRKTTDNFAQSWGGSAALQLDWTIFNGKRMYATYDVLTSIRDRSSLQLKADMEAVASEIYNAFYAVLYQQELLNVVNKTISLYEERAMLSRRRWEIGSASKMEFLQASLDLKEQQSRRIQLEVDLQNAKAALNEVLSRPPETAFSPQGAFTTPSMPVWEEVVTNVANNKQLAVIEQEIQIGEHRIREAESYRYPTLNWTNRLNYNYDQNQAAFLRQNQNTGFFTGLTFRWTIFNGKVVRNNIGQAKLQVQQYKLVHDESKLRVQTEVFRGLNTMRNALEQLAFEEESLKVGDEAILVATERFKVGNGTGLELREVQRSYIDLQARLVAAQYNAKVAEIRLLFLQGGLLKN